MRRIDRREFAKEASLAFLTGVSVTVSACGGGSGYSSTPSTMPPAGTTDEVGQISANHGHSAVIQAAWISAGTVPPTLDIRGTASHSHMIPLPAAAVADMKAGKAVQMESTTGEGHTHMVTFNPNSTEPPTRY